MYGFDLKNSVYYHYDKFPPKNIDYKKIMNHILAATEAISRFDQMLKSMRNSEFLLVPLRNKEAVISSRIEGTISTLDEIMQYEADYSDETTEATNVRNDIIETLLYKRTLKNAQKALLDGYPFSKHLLKTMHQQLLFLGRGANKAPGEFKREQNYLGEKFSKKIAFVPISPEKLELGLDNFFTYINKDESPILLKTAISHLEFEALHPFYDGNGRIGRMLITLILWRAGIISEPHFYISAYFEENKDEYINLMREVSRSENWDDWCIFFFKGVAQQAKSNLEISEKIADLYEEMKIRFSQLLSSKWSLQVLDYIFANPMFRNNKFALKTGITPTTASRFSKILQENHILKIVEEGTGRKATLYSFEPLMQLIRD